MLEQCGPEPSAVCRAVLESTGSGLAAQLADALVVRGGRILLAIVLALVATKLLRRLMTKLVLRVHGGTARSRQRAKTLADLLGSAGTFGIWVMAVLTILGELGIDLAPLIAGAGIIGIALGFGAQNLVRDFLSGIFMLLEDQYGVGDVIDVGDASGTVEGVSLRSTRLRDVEGNLWHFPNGVISRVANKSQEWSRAVLDIPVAYDSDLEHVTNVIKRTADMLWHQSEAPDLILVEPEVWGVENFGPDGLVVRLVVTTEPLAQWRVSRELRRRIKEAFEQEGIEIPFPQRTVWHRDREPAGAR